jgi:hypothetical protein
MSNEEVRQLAESDQLEALLVADQVCITLSSGTPLMSAYRGHERRRGI